MKLTKEMGIIGERKVQENVVINLQDSMDFGNYFSLEI